MPLAATDGEGETAFDRFDAALSVRRNFQVGGAIERSAFSCHIARRARAFVRHDEEPMLVVNRGGASFYHFDTTNLRMSFGGLRDAEYHSY